MRAVILAAGRGARLNGTGGGGHKCLITMGAEKLIERQIRELHEAGIEDIAVVVGCEADRVRATCGPGVEFVENTVYAQTNSLYSLWLARPLLLDGFVVLNCDVLFHPQLLRDLLGARHENALLLSCRGDSDPLLGDEEMKVKVRAGRVVDMSKQLDPADADGENVGIVKFGRAGAELLVRHMERLIGDGAVREWAPRAFRDFARERPLYAVGTRGYPWIEIDFPEDYRRAVEEVLPEIDRFVEPAAPYAPPAAAATTLDGARA